MQNLNPDRATLHNSDLFGTPGGDGGLRLLGVALRVTGNCDMVVCPSFIGSISTAMLQHVYALIELVHFTPLPDKSIVDAISAKFTQTVGELLLIQAQSRFRVYAAVGQHQEMELIWFKSLRMLSRKRGPTSEAILALAGLVEKYAPFCKLLATDAEAEVPEDLAAGDLTGLRRFSSKKRKGASLSSASNKPPPSTKKPPSNAPPGAGGYLATVSESAPEAQEPEIQPGCYWMRSRKAPSGGGQGKQSSTGARKRKPGTVAEDDEIVRNVVAKKEWSVEEDVESVATSVEDGGSEEFSEDEESFISSSDELGVVLTEEQKRRREERQRESLALKHIRLLSAIAAQGGLAEEGGGESGYKTAAVSCGWELIESAASGDSRHGKLVQQTSSLEGWTLSPERGSGMLLEFLDCL
ncbi:hypothetical protein KFL_001870260 [Klebsormidium nitens]|uniref:Uncharacterized protein n=1 Tax=Klebsormidium nitens TaxID=105231 RepID=A0A1Y1I0H1_KLENI|nr:hypothetical protein KFL_001870260 [Klebsormidium nitens]|eukprot:GAQ84404.1 hypothetical protein KFL_001870260 [Klebsormidium nitens]